MLSFWSGVNYESLMSVCIWKRQQSRKDSLVSKTRLLQCNKLVITLLLHMYLRIFLFWPTVAHCGFLYGFTVLPGAHGCAPASAGGIPLPWPVSQHALCGQRWWTYTSTHASESGIRWPRCFCEINTYNLLLRTQLVLSKSTWNPDFLFF